jgi:hypothetical protein
MCDPQTEPQVPEKIPNELAGHGVGIDDEDVDGARGGGAEWLCCGHG